MMATKRGKTSNAYDHFRAEENHYICIVDECGTKLVKKRSADGGASYKLKRHLMRFHPTVFQDVKEKDAEPKEKLPKPSTPKKGAITS